MSGVNPEKLTRLRHKQISESTEILQFLDSQRFGYLAIADATMQPIIIPIAYARLDDSIVVHGSTGAGTLTSLTPETKVCFNVTRIDGLVLARSAFESSVHYESVNILGRPRVLQSDEKVQMLNALTEKLFPGRTSTLRPMTSKEIAATLVISISMDHVVAKRSDGQPGDEGEDINWPVWAGILPIEQRFAKPIAADNLDPQYDNPPPYLETWTL